MPRATKEPTSTNGYGGRLKGVAEDRTITIPAPKFQTAAFTIIGIAPMVQNKFSAKALEQMKAKQQAGSTATKGKKREPKDFDAAYQGAMHISTEGWHGIPAPAFRNAMIDACRMCGFKMTEAKMCIFAEADGFDRDDGTPLVKITKGEPKPHEAAVRVQTTTDVRIRPMWQPGWEATVRLRWDLDKFTPDDVANLLMRAGLQVGIGEGRPFSKTSAGMGWGMFEIKER